MFFCSYITTYVLGSDVTMAAIQPQPPLGAPVAGLSLAEALEMRAKAGKPVRVGLIGAGQMGTDIVVQISQMTGIEIAAVADIAPDRVAEAAALAGRCLLYTSRCV